MKFEVLKQSHLKRNILIGMGVILVLTTVILTFTRAKYRTTQSIPLVNGTINYSLADLNIVALYIDGVEAEELDSNTTYTLDTTNSTCTYKDGTTIDNLTLSYDSDTKAFSITPYTVKGTKCTLYFEKSKKATDVIKNLYSNNQKILAYDDYGNLRYIGADPNNYVYFNCNDYNSPSSNTCELWRVIGVMNNIETETGITENLIKIVRSEIIGEYSWDTSNMNNWNVSSLQKTLNGDYLNASGSFSNLGIKNDTTRNMVETVIWRLGASNTVSDVTASMFYERERGTIVYENNPAMWTGKIALIYPSDYAYAASGGESISRETCLATPTYDWYEQDLSDCKNYLKNTWMLTTVSIDSIGVFNVHNNGYMYHNGSAIEANGILPALYLVSNTIITSGTGTSSDPYILALN